MFGVFSTTFRPFMCATPLFQELFRQPCRHTIKQHMEFRDNLVGSAVLLPSVILSRPTSPRETANNHKAARQEPATREAKRAQQHGVFSTRFPH